MNIRVTGSAIRTAHRGNTMGTSPSGRPCTVRTVMAARLAVSSSSKLGMIHRRLGIAPAALCSALVTGGALNTRPQVRPATRISIEVGCPATGIIAIAMAGATGNRPRMRHDRTPVHAFVNMAGCTVFVDHGYGKVALGRCSCPASHGGMRTIVTTCEAIRCRRHLGVVELGPRPVRGREVASRALRRGFDVVRPHR